jgi:hypothetical protein
VSFGMTVTLRRDDGREQSFRIVGEDETDPSRGTLSHRSPLARAPDPWPWRSGLNRWARSRHPGRQVRACSLAKKSPALWLGGSSGWA